MMAPFNLEKLLEKGAITSELEYERAMEASKSLRLMSRDNSKYVLMRKKLIDIIERYEKREWSNVDSVGDLKIKESDEAEAFILRERTFIVHRQKRIKQRLREMKMSQADLTTILGHKSKTYISELMNGISPFTLRDLVILHHFLSIEMKELVPTFLNKHELERLKQIRLEFVSKPSSKTKTNFV